MLHETSARQLWKILEKKYLTKSVVSRLQLKSKLYGFQMQRGCSVNEHLNRYMKLLTDLVNVDVETSEENKAVMLAQRPSTLVLMMINSCSYVY